MRATLQLLVLCLSASLAGCVTVTERYQLGSPERLSEASFVAANRLGWTTERLADGKFRLIDRMNSGLLRRAWVDVSAGPDGVLTLSGDLAERGWDMRPTLGVVAPLLAQATLQELGVAAEGPPMERTSVPLTVGLNLLLPAAGAVYALRGSPYAKTTWANHWAFWMGSHAALDVGAGINLALGVDYLQRGERNLGLAYVVGSIAGLVLNRMIALLVQVPAVQPDPGCSLAVGLG